MSQEDAEGIVRRFLGALERGDYDEALSCLLPEVEWNNTTAFPGQRTIRGPAAIIEFWKSLIESFDPEDHSMEIEELRPSGRRVVAAVRSQGRGAGSGVPVDVRWALGFWIGEGGIGRVDISGDYRKALEAAGLQE